MKIAASLPSSSAQQVLQPLDGRIDVDHVVADFGVGHGGPHGGRGLGDGIAAQVDDGGRSWGGHRRVQAES